MYVEGVVAAAFLAVLVAAALLGLEVWVLAIAVLGWVVTRPLLTGTVLARAGLALALSAAAYVAGVVLVARLGRA